MGLPNRLHGKATYISLHKDDAFPCPFCLRKIDTIRLLYEGEKVVKVCPYCARKLPAKFLQKLQRR